MVQTLARLGVGLGMAQTGRDAARKGAWSRCRCVRKRASNSETCPRSTRNHAGRENGAARATPLAPSFPPPHAIHASRRERRRKRRRTTQRLQWSCSSWNADPFGIQTTAGRVDRSRWARLPLPRTHTLPLPAQTSAERPGFALSGLRAKPIGPGTGSRRVVFQAIQLPGPPKLTQLPVQQSASDWQPTPPTPRQAVMRQVQSVAASLAQPQGPRQHAGRFAGVHACAFFRQRL